MRNYVRETLWTLLLSILLVSIGIILLLLLWFAPRWLFTARCSRGEPMTTWLHEWLFRRPSREDSRCHRTWGLQKPGGPHLRREHLLGEALREESRSRRISSPEEKPRICSEAGRESHEAAEGGPEAEAFRHSPRASRLHTRPHGALGESLDDLPRHSP